MNEEKVAAYLAQLEKQGLPPVVRKELLIDPSKAVDGRPPADPLDTGDRGKDTIKGFSLREIIKTSANVDNFAFSTRGQEVMKALSEGTDSAGGYLTPPGFLAQVIERENQLITLAPNVHSQPVNTDKGSIPSLSTDVSVVIGTEGEEKTETTPVFSEVTWQLYKVVALIKTSLELLDDSSINLESYLSEKLGEALARKKDELIAMGTGSSQPTGLYYCSGVTAVASIGALDYATLVQLVHTVDVKYRDNCSWVMNDTNVERIRNIQDTSGAYIFVRGDRNTPNTRAIDTLLGYPIRENPNLSSGAIIFGDLKRYWLFNKGGIRIAATKEGGDSFANDQLWIKCTERYDGQCVLAEAFAKGTGITS